MKTRVQKWGHSLGARLPKSFAEELGICDGSPIDMTLEERAIVIKPDLDRAWDLETLLAGVTDENIHPAWETESLADAGEPGAKGPRRSGNEPR